jgi:hypothetical protein
MSELLRPARRWKGPGGNREVPPLPILRACSDKRAARAKACLGEGGSWGKQGFPHGTERPKAAEDDAWAAGPEEA